MKSFVVRVYFEDTDCGRIVYHTNYIKYCERARSELFFTRGRLPVEGECGFVVKSLEAQFHLSARLGDMLEVRSRVLERGGASLVLLQDIYRIYDALHSKECEELLFSARIKLAYVNVLNSRPTRIPQAMWEVLGEGEL